MNKETRNLILFFLATFVATYIFYFIIVANGWDPYTMPGMAFLLLGGSAPSWVGILMVLLTYDKEHRRDYFKRCISFKQIKAKWWAVIIFIFPLFFAVVILVDVLLGGEMPGMTNLKAYIAQPWIIPMALFMSFLSGPFSEEPGWRGYSLDPLVKRLGYFGGGATLGFIWGIWHLPLFFMPQTWHGQIGFRFEGFWLFTLASIGLGLIMCWVYYGTGRSVLSALMMHLAYNFTGNTVRPFSERVHLMYFLLVVAVGLLIGAFLQQRRPRHINPSLSSAPELQDCAPASTDR